MNHHFDHETIESYVRGELDEAHRAAFEEHYFGCDECLYQVQALRIARTHLGAVPRKQTPRWPIWAIAAGVVLVAFLAKRQISPTNPATKTTTDYSQLAVVRAPKYEAPVMRGASTEADRQFAQAMQPYAKGQYAESIPLLTPLTAPAAKFYLGASYLLTNQPANAIQPLELAAADPNFADEAHLLLGEAWLKQQNPDQARKELQQARGDQSKEAQRLLESLK